MDIRRATPADAARLAVLGAATFLHSFAHDHPGDGLLSHIETQHSRDWYAAALASDDTALWIGETDRRAPVAYAILTAPALPGAGDGDLELKRIYLLGPWQGGGHGKALMDLVIEEAIHRGARRLLLAVYEQNAKARAFYARQGFAEIGRTLFMVGDTAFEDIVLARPLTPTG